MLELLSDLMKEKPVEETGYQNIIIVDNAPKVGPDRMAKLPTRFSQDLGRLCLRIIPLTTRGISKGKYGEVNGVCPMRR